MSVLSQMIAWIERVMYRLSREYCYDEMEEKGSASMGCCGGQMGGDKWSDYLAYSCIDCPHYVPIVGGEHETAN